MTIAMNTIEEGIRAKAKEKAMIRFRAQLKELTQYGHAGTWCKEFTYEDMREFERLADKLMHHIVIPLAEEAAIKDFLNAYQTLIVEYPDLVEATNG